MHFYALFALPCRTINCIYKGYIDLNILLAYSYAIVTNKTAAERFSDLQITGEFENAWAPDDFGHIFLVWS